MIPAIDGSGLTRLVRASAYAIARHVKFSYQTPGVLARNPCHSVSVNDSDSFHSLAKFRPKTTSEV